MNATRRSFLTKAMWLSTGMAMGPALAAAGDTCRASGGCSKKIAIEEAFATLELFEEWRKLLADGVEEEPGFSRLYGPFLSSPATKGIRDQLIDVGEGRIRDMCRSGIDMQVLSVTAPGIQVFGKAKATGLARKLNDELASTIEHYPDRYAGMAALAPQDPKEAARELERAVKSLGLKGALINSHTRGEYLDAHKYWPIFDAAQALDVPIYLHPRTPAPAMLRPYLAYGLEGAGWGFAAETSLHAMRLILSGLFDEFPQLVCILGHMGEGIPFWLRRIDSRFANKTWTSMDGTRTPRERKKSPSEYFRENFVITTSGMNWEPALMFAHAVLGPERILFAVDYPYESSENAVQEMDNAPMSDEDKARICHRNAERLLKLRVV